MDPKISPDAPAPKRRASGLVKLLVLLLVLATGLIAYLSAEKTGMFEDQAAGKSQTTAASEVQGKQAAGAPGTARSSLREPPPAPKPSQHGTTVEIGPGQAGSTQSTGASAQSAEQAQRKAPYGLKHSVDVVVRSDESIKVGGVEVSVAELERSLVVGKRGQVLERSLGRNGDVTTWGVHLVRQKENLWNIHYRLLAEFLANRGMELPPDADEPTASGQSSGVGKILKFAEHMVGVYNLKTRAMSQKLDVLEPGGKVVIFNLSEIFEQLSKIEPHNLKGVMYDGRVLLFPGSEIKPLKQPPQAPAPTAPMPETR